VVLAGCGGTGPSGVTPEDPQTPYGGPEPGTTAATSGTTTHGQSSPPGLSVLNRADETVSVRVTLESVTNETTFYERETAMAPGSQRYLTGEVGDRDQYRITVAAENATHSHEVFAGESYVVVVANTSAIDGRHATD
jgi:hypothetical protein